MDIPSCAIYDLQVLPNDDSSHNSVGNLLESEFLQDLENALTAHSNEIKVWNLSLRTNKICSINNFSSLAVELDKLQEKYNVTFVINANNYEDLPLLNYPRNTPHELAKKKITTPTNNILKITTKSISHVNHNNNKPQNKQPSAFSKHDASPNFIIKPDLVHYNKSCNKNISEIHKINSINENSINESYKTNFSTPFISKLLANIYHHVTPTPSPILTKTLLTHHTKHPITNNRVPDNEINFISFGKPSNLINYLECNPWNMTLVFEDDLRPSFYLEWDQFPYPSCLTRDGRFFEDIWMTVAFTPLKNEQ